MNRPSNQQIKPRQVEPALTGEPSKVNQLFRWLMTHKKICVLSVLAIVVVFLLLSPAPSKNLFDKLIGTPETSNSSETVSSQVSLQTDPSKQTEGRIAQNDPGENQDLSTQETKEVLEEPKPEREISVPPPQTDAATAVRPSPPPPSWTLTFLDVNENQGDSVSVSYLDRDGKPISVTANRKGRSWEFEIPEYISIVTVDLTKEGQVGWTSLHKKEGYNTYDFQGFTQLLLSR